ncbi:hypothetical protein AQI88_29530 [Streptomyces cellostaticus]|uniref:Uncharacterized protein n=1 Tax=Streptomyces cellostaticus TaxID=67285 RepID=A0A101NGV8_9ACTN|nr:hypothetical protein AQI88_29530 [Streptomyces cellostaticus]
MAGVRLRYALIPLHGYGIAVATVNRMLDPEATGEARVLGAGENLPYGAQPVLVADTTVWAAMRVEEMLRSWGPLPKPWLVLVADAPATPAAAARYRLRALEGRLAGTASVPYLAVLRAVEGPEEALEHKDVRVAADRLRRRMERK